PDTHWGNAHVRRAAIQPLKHFSVEPQIKMTAVICLYRRSISLVRLVCAVCFVGVVSACGGDTLVSNPPESVGSDPAQPPGESDPSAPGAPDPTDPINPPLLPSPPPPLTNDDFRPPGYNTLVFVDNFDGTQLDRNKWCTRMPWGGGPALEFEDNYCERWYGNGYGDYANITENQRFRDNDSSGENLHVVGNGTIRLRATNVASHAFTRYEAAALRSKFVFKPDPATSYYVTSRVRLPDVRGTWPAFFLIPSLEPAGINQWPPEIDIFEGPLNGDTGTTRTTVTQHAQVWGPQTASQRSEWTFLGTGFNSASGYYDAGTNLREKWMEIGAEWAEQGVCYFIDGVKTACENYAWVDNNNRPGNPAAIIAYLAVGGPWAGSNGIDDLRFPASLEIDHIRVYQGGGNLASAIGTSILAMSPERVSRQPQDSRRAVTEPDVFDDYAALGYALLFAEEFNGTELNRSRWCTRLIYGGGPPLQVPDSQCTQFGQGTADVAATDNAQRFRDINSLGERLHDVSGGTIKLRATRTGPDPVAPYESAALRSKTSFPSGSGWQYYITTRVKLPDIQGTWPSMALMSSLGDDGVGRWPPQVSLFDGPLNGGALSASTLIQKTENDGAQTKSGGHSWNYVGPGFDTSQSVFGSTTTLRGRWLEIGIEWTEGHVCWFINGVATACENYYWFDSQGELANPASITAHLAVGGGLAGENGVDDANIPTQLEIDWIRVYQRRGF
ncbi:MAG: hypothetical protein WBD34_21805, partial [Burkholderiaceae bacterium]